MKTFFVPAHITGFFEICSNTQTLMSGSRGAGIVLSSGVETCVKAREAEDNQIKVFVNGKASPQHMTTISVIKKILEYTGKVSSVEIRHSHELSEAMGFGLSASMAIGAALGLNHALRLNLDLKELGGFAHLAEIENQTGLGDVSAEFSKGLVIRLVEGAPGIGKIKSIPFEEYNIITFLVGGPIYTKNILKDHKNRQVINYMGKSCFDALLKKPTPERFLELSKKFTLETNLAQNKVKNVILSLENQGIVASMCMLGNAVFTLTKKPEKIKEMLDFPSIVSEPLKESFISSGL